MKRKESHSLNVGGRWAVVIVVLVFLAFISFLSSTIIGFFISASDVQSSGNVAHIKITGPIVAQSTSSLFESDVSDSTQIVDLIKKADENPEIKAMLFEINSPGGTAVASYEIAEAIKRTNKTTVAWIREIGASGAYWIASSTDHIVVNPLSITGSIGVIASYIDFSGTLNRYNASYQRLVSGNYKDMGSPFRKMTYDEEQIMQDNLDTIRDFFVKDVSDNRHLSEASVEEAADGRFYLGRDALKLGLVDDLGGKREAVEWIEKKENIDAELSEYRKPRTLAQMLTDVFSEQSFFVGQGIGRSMINTDPAQGMRVVT